MTALIVTAAPYVAPWLPSFIKAWTRGRGRRMTRAATYRPTTERGRHRRVTFWQQINQLDRWQREGC